MLSKGFSRSTAGRPGSAWISLLTILSLVTSLILVLPGPVQAAAVTYNVTRFDDAVNASANGSCDAPGGGCTLREAIMEANANPGFDTIVLPIGTYTLSITGTEGNNNGVNVLEEDLDITDGVKIVGSGDNREGSPGATIIQAASTPGGNPWRVFHIKTSTTSSNRAVTFEAVTIRHGWTGDLAYGGGIFYDPVDGDGTLHIYNSIITLNRSAYDGGGIMLSSDTGGTYSGLLAIVEKSEISYNKAGSTASGTRSPNGGGVGGGITAGTVVPLQVKQSNISYNTAYDSDCTDCFGGGDGGGIKWWDNASTSADNLSYVEDSIISYNTADDDVFNAGRGGGMYVGRPLKVRNVSVIGNHADYDGGGLYHSAITGDYHYLANVTVSGNTAAKDGAGLMMTPGGTGEIHLVNVTVTNNRSDHNNDGTGSGGGIYRTDTGHLMLYNSIVGGNFKGSAGSTANDIGYLASALHSSSSHNVIGTGGSGGLTHGSNNNQVGLTTAQIGLGPLADNGSAVPASHVGARLTHGLLGGSLALDAGSNTYVDGSANGGPYTTDGRGTGWARKLDAGDSEDTTDEVDAGALEMHPAIGDIANASIIQDPPAPFSTTLHVGDGDLVLNPSPTITVQSQSVAGLIASTTGSLSGSTGTLTATPGAGKYGTATIRVKVDDTYNGTLQEMFDEFTLTVVQRPNLTIDKSHTGSFRQGDVGKTYSLSVSNLAGSGAVLAPSDPLLAGDNTVRVTDTLPTGLTPTAASGTNWSCTITGQTVDCARTAGNHSLAAGSSYPPITVTVSVAYDAGTPEDNILENTATVSGGGDNTTGNNADTDPTTIILTPDLTVAKSHIDPFQQGQTGAAYTLTITNLGPGPTDSNYTVTDTLPTGMTYVSGSGTGWSCSAAGQAVTCTGTTTLAKDATSTLTLNLDVARDAATTAPHQLTNTASIAGGGELSQRAANNTSGGDVTTITQMPDLTISKAPVGTFREGRTAQYELTVTNAGYAPTSGTITVTDTVPAGMTPTAATGTDWTCTVTGQVVSCERTTALAAAATSIITVNVTVADDTGTSLTNTAAVSGGGQIYTANDSGSHVTTIVQTSDMTVSKSHTGNFTQGQTNASYIITVTNAGAGPTDAEVTVSDTLPTGLTPTAASGTGWACTITLQTVSCSRSDVLAGGSSYPDITLTVTVDDYADPSVTNSVSVSGGGEIDATNNGDDDPTTINQLPDLVIAKSHTGDFEQGQTGATYTLTVSNSGTGLTSGTVTVTDTLPTGLTPTAVSGPTDWSCEIDTVNPQLVTCTTSEVLAGGASYDDITITVDVAVNAAASVDNTAAVSGGSDTDTTNNTDTDSTTIIAKPDLTVTKVANGTFRQGQSASFTLTVNNVGGQATTGDTVTLTDTFDSAFSPGTVTTDTGVWTCSAVGQTLTCTSTAVVNGGVSFAGITVDVTIAADAATSVDNTANASGGGELNTGNNTTTISVPVAQAPNLSITKSHTGNFTQGQTGATFTLLVSNGGGGATSGTVTVTDTLPTGLTATAISGTGWTCTLATLECTRSDVLAASGSYPAITLTVNVAANAAPSLDNTATVSGGSDLTSGNNTDTDTVTVIQQPDLVITKSHTGDFTQGQNGASYTLTVTNSGTGLTSGTVTVTDTLPTGLTATAISGTGWSCTLGTLTCTRSDALAAGASYPAILITVDVSTTASASVNNTAAVSGGGDVDNTNNTATDATTITGKSNLTVAKSHTGNFQQGQMGAAYTLTVTNAGGAATSGTATATDTVPAGLTPTSASGTGWTCDISGQTVTCTSADAVNPGGSYPDISLTVNVAQNAPASVTNEVAVSGGGQIYTADDTASDPTNIDPTPDLTVTKSHTDPFRQGLSHSYTITVTNSGSAPTSGVVTVADTLPTGLTATAMSGTGWTCTLGILTCTRSDVLAAGDSYPQITLTVDVAQDAPALVTNAAQVSGGGELTTTNNLAADPTAIVQVADLTVTKTHRDPLVQDRHEVYSITVTNIGPGPTDAPVNVTDTLPVGLTAVTMSGNGWTCDLPTTTCSRTDALAPGGSYPVILLRVLVDQAATDILTNEVQVSGGGQSNLSNDTATDPGKVVPPDPPGPPDWVQISVTTTLTRESTVVVTGSTNPSGMVDVNGRSVQADEQGAFTVQVALVEGDNLITATVGSATGTVTVNRDTTPPALILTVPQTITSALSVRLTATAEEGAKVTILGQETTDLKVPLVLGENLFRATATDAVGNTATATITVTRTTKPGALKKQQVQPDQATEVVTKYLTITLPSGAVAESIELVLQIPGTNPELIQADSAAGLIAVVEINAITVPGGKPVTKLQKSVTLTFPYDPEEVPDPSLLRIYYYNPTLNVWVELESTVDNVNHTVSGKTDHFTLFALLTGSGPTLNTLPSTTSQATLDVTGKAEPGQSVALVVNGATQTTGLVSADGTFRLQAKLVKGQNQIHVSVDGLASREAVVEFQAARGGDDGQRSGFEDTEGHWAAAWIQQMVLLGVVNGYQDNTFRPEARVSRLEFAVMVARTLKLDQADLPLTFGDQNLIPAWATGPVGAAVQAEIITGRSNGLFDPTAPVTRAEVAVMLSRALSHAGHDTTAGALTFSDSGLIPEWARDHVSVAARYGLITGYQDRSFRPGNTTTRAEAVTMLARLVAILG